MEHRATKEVADGYCRRCGYALQGLPEPRCPECGQPFDPTDGRTFARRKPSIARRRIGRAAKVGVLLALVVAGWMAGRYGVDVAYMFEGCRVTGERATRRAVRVFGVPLRWSDRRIESSVLSRLLEGRGVQGPHEWSVCSIHIVDYWTGQPRSIGPTMNRGLALMTQSYVQMDPFGPLARRYPILPDLIRSDILPYDDATSVRLAGLVFLMCENPDSENVERLLATWSELRSQRQHAAGPHDASVDKADDELSETKVRAANGAP